MIPIKILSHNLSSKKFYRVKLFSVFILNIFGLFGSLLATEQAAEIPPLKYQCPSNQTPTNPGIRINAKNEGSKASKNKFSANADNIIHKGGKAVLEGKVDIRLNDMEITAKNAEISDKNQVLEAKNGLSFKSSQIMIHSDYLKVDLIHQEIEAKKAQYQLKNKALRGKSKELKIEGSGKVTMKNANFTSCPPGKETWQIKAKHIEIDPEKGIGEATNMTLQIQNVPILYLPYIQFPASNQRLSGLLIPTFRSSSQNGRDISIPYYWNIAPNFDDTFTPRFISERGILLNNEFRYLNSKNSGTFTADYLSGDKKAGGVIPDNRYHFLWQHKSQFNEHWKANLDFEDISDDNYFFDLGTDLVSTNIIELNRQISVEYNDDYLHIKALASSDLTLNTNIHPYQRLPQIEWHSQFPIKSLKNMRLDFSGEVSSFHKTNDVNATRSVIVPAISYPFNWDAGFIIPKVKLNYRHYMQKGPNDPVTLNKDVSIPIFSVDSGTYLERNVQYKGKKYIQTLEPRLYYLYVPARDQQQFQLYDSYLKTASYQQLFQDNRYSGYDRIGDTNQFSLGINSRLVESKSGEEILRFGVGQAYFLSKRSVSLQSIFGNTTPIVENLQAKTSPILADLVVNVARDWRINSTSEWQPDTNQMQSSSLRFQYRPTDLNVINIGHRKRLLVSGEKIEQFDISYSWKIHLHWRLIGRWHQDLTNHKNIETLFGTEYDSCCWAVRIVNRRYLSVPLSPTGVPILGGKNNYNGGISIQFVLKGLSSLGNSSFLNNSISGYQDPYRLKRNLKRDYE